MKKLNRDGLFGRDFMEFYLHEGEKVMWLEPDYDWEDDRYECGCCKCCGCMCDWNDLYDE